MPDRITNKLVSFNIDSDALISFENHLDSTRIKLRKRGVANFTRKQFFRYLLETSIKSFEPDDFIRFLNNNQ